MSPDTMLAYRMVRLIETHPDQLATDLLEKTKASDKTRNYVEKVPPEDLKQRVYEIYKHLGQWLQDKSEDDIRARYTVIGELRARQGVPLSQLIWAIVLVKDNLLDFLKTETVLERPAEVFGQLEILQLLDEFFDRATYHAAVGYEGVRNGSRS
jgi:hypothetical protein